MQKTKADKRRMAYVKSPTRTPAQSSDWYTPKEYIKAVSATLGGIDLDPYSDAKANETVKAKRIWTKADDGDVQSWQAKSVFMNPPYGVGVISRATGKFVEEFTQNRFKKGIVLMNNVTDTVWFKKLVAHALVMCFTDHRISFNTFDNKTVSNNTRGQIFLFFCSSAQSSKLAEKFKKEFRPLGLILVHG